MAKASESTLDQNDPYRSAMRHLIGQRWQDVWSAMPVAIAGEDPEGVHDVRVASRRLRAAMDVAVEAFPATWYRPLHKVAKSITAELGAVRDRDVILEFLLAEREAAPPEEQPGIDRLITRVTREREAARVEMLDFLSDIEARGASTETERRFGADAVGKPGPPS